MGVVDNMAFKSAQATIFLKSSRTGNVFRSDLEFFFTSCPRVVDHND